MTLHKEAILINGSRYLLHFKVRVEVSDFTQLNHLNVCTQINLKWLTHLSFLKRCANDSDFLVTCFIRKSSCQDTISRWAQRNQTNNLPAPHLVVDYLDKDSRPQACLMTSWIIKVNVKGVGLRCRAPESLFMCCKRKFSISIITFAGNTSFSFIDIRYNNVS